MNKMLNTKDADVATLLQMRSSLIADRAHRYGERWGRRSGSLQQAWSAASAEVDALIAQRRTLNG